MNTSTQPKFVEGLGKQADSFLHGAGYDTATPPLDPRDIAARIIASFLTVLGILMITYVVYAGYLWVTSQGEEDKIKKAQHILLNCALGLILILSAYGLANLADTLLRKTNPDNYCKIEKNEKFYADPLGPQANDTSNITAMVFGADTFGCELK